MARYDRGDEVKTTNVRNTFRRLATLLQKEKKSFTVGIILTVVRTIAVALLPVFFREIIDSGVRSANLEFFLWAVAGYAVIVILQGFFEYVQAIIVGKMGLVIVADLKGKLFEHVLGLSTSYFDANATGRLLSRIESDTQKLFSFFSNVGLQLLGALLTIIFSLTIMLNIDMRMTIAGIVAAPIILGIGTFLFRRLRPLYKQDRANYGVLTGVLGEHVPQIPLLRSLYALEWSFRQIYSANDTKYTFSKAMELRQSLVWTLVMMTPVAAITGILWYAAEGVLAQTISIGTLWMFIQYIFAAVQPVIVASEQLNEAQRALGAAERVFELLDTASDVQQPLQPKPFAFKHRIALQQVEFSYVPNQLVLKNISLTIPKGTTTALVGSTGSGKTTIASLIARWYDVSSGKILFDDTDIRELNLQDIAKAISIIPQDVFLFPGTVLDNLRGMRTDIPEQRVLSAIEELGMQDFIARLPQGLQTQVGERGGFLSLGERQLLAFIRAVTFNPQVLIIDEATSSIDVHTEALLQKSMEKMLRGRTAIIIAHRLVTIQQADIIVVLERGVIIEQGNHQELMLQNGKYATMVKLQQKGAL